MTRPRALVVDALAAYRLTRLVTADTITEPARAAVIAAAYRSVGYVGEPDSWDEVALNDPRPPKLAELVICRWCTGMWVAFGVVAARRVLPKAWAPVSEALALAAAAALLARLED